MKRRKIDSGYIVIVSILTLWAILTIYPFYNVFLTSITPYSKQMEGKFSLLPQGFDFSVYKMLLSDISVLNSLLISFLVTILGTTYNMLLTVSMGYALAKKNYIGRKFFITYVIVPMFFSGGMIPYYLVVKGLGLIDSIFSMIIPVGINSFYLIILKNYFLTIPESLEESAKIDGANELIILGRIVLPVSLPMVATILLFYAVDRWNEYFNAMLFITSPNKQPLQVVLRNLLIKHELSASASMSSTLLMSNVPIYPEAMRSAMVIIAALPVLVIYPFLQKYFTQGILIGSIKA